MKTAEEFLMDKLNLKDKNQILDGSLQSFAKIMEEYASQLKPKQSQKKVLYDHPAYPNIGVTISKQPVQVTEEAIEEILKANLIEGTYGIITSKATKAIVALIRKENEMKLYRRHTEVTDKDEMHLEVDHSLEPVTIPDEEEIYEICPWIDELFPVNHDRWIEGFKAALTYLTER